MVLWNILQNVSFSYGEKLLPEEGYVEEECIEEECADAEEDSYDRLFLYPFCLKCCDKL